MIDEDSVQNYVGREETRNDRADPERMQRLAALLDREWRPDQGMPALGHFVLFRPDERQSRIGLDGHPVRNPDGMLPDVPLPRRMWAGSRIRFEQDARPDAALTRRSRLMSAVPKSGKSGQMLFCTVEHQIRDADSDLLLISEEQDIVYREAHKGSGVSLRPSIEPQFTPTDTRVVHVDPVMLFRYSALTFNAHRIHYDREYARTDEGYPGLVVHGPYLATLLFDHLVQVSGRRVAEFSFKAMSPSFDGDALTLGARIEGENARLSIVSPAGLAMSAIARLI